MDWKSEAAGLMARLRDLMAAKKEWEVTFNSFVVDSATGLMWNLIDNLLSDAHAICQSIEEDEEDFTDEEKRRLLESVLLGIELITLSLPHEFVR